MKIVEKVTVLPVITRHDIPTERVLNGAMAADLKGCFVVGINPDGNVQLLCPPCNLAKNAKHPIDWAQENGRLL